LLLALLLPAGPARAQPAAGTTTPTPAWELYAAGYGYIVLEDDDFVTLSFTADRGRLHLEARYNYEDLDTGSLWAGFNLAGGGDVSYELTAMLGAAFGATDGVLPGYRGALCWKAFDLSSEGEYLFDSDDRAQDFFYSWSELGWSRAQLRVGLAAQRTRVYRTDADIAPGLFAGVSISGRDAAVYVFEPGSDAAAIMLLAGISF
jgi:hypothetical protein